MHEIILHVTPDDFAKLEDAVFEVEHATRWNLVEDMEPKTYRVQGIFESEDEARSAWAELSDASGVQAQAKVRPLEESDWKDSYKTHFKPWSIGHLHWVPVWLRDEYELPEGHDAVWLDPGMAFGTGNHETTRLCVERLFEVEPAKEGREAMTVVDAGTGSGILAISAVKLGFTQVSGFDNDQDAIKIACDNSVLNDTLQVRFHVGDLQNGFLEKPYDVILANILAPTLVESRDSIVEALKDDGTLILSGILSKEAESVKHAYSKLRDWKSAEIHELGEWSSVTLRG